MLALPVFLLLIGGAPTINVNAPICNGNAATPANTLQVVRAKNGYPATGLTVQAMVVVFDLKRKQNVGWMILDDFGQQYLEPRAGYDGNWIPRGARKIVVTFSDGQHTLFMPANPWKPSAPYVLGMCLNTK